MATAVNEQIGWLIDGNRVICRDKCALVLTIIYSHRIARIFRVNIGDYKQTCHTCGKVLVEPKTPSWPELFEKVG